MIQFIPIRTNHTSYPFVEQLMLDSFPLTERRTEKTNVKSPITNRVSNAC